MNLLVLGLAFGIFGLGRSELHHFESDLAKDISLKLNGSHRMVNVKSGLDLRVLQGDFRSVTISASHFQTNSLPLFTEPMRPHDGRVRKLNLVLNDFKLGSLHLDQLTATIPNSKFDLGLALRKRSIRLSESGTGTGTVTISDRDLETFVVEKFHEIKSVHITITPGRIRVEGHGRFLIFDTDFSVEASLVIVNGTALALTDPVILFDGQKTDPESQRAVLEALNPVVDLDKDLRLFGAIHVTSVSLQKGKLIASGITTIPTAPEARQ